MRRKTMKKVKRIMLIVLGCILVFFFSLCILLLVVSPGKIKPFVDDKGNKIDNSISEKIYVDINGVKQGMFIKGKNINNPVLLFVHGGPLMPEYFLNDKYPTGLEEYFTICWWEQPGVGLSYSADISKENLTLDAIIDDTIEVTNFLRE